MLYKICASAEWKAATAAGTYTGSADDRRDGFIHLSTAAQVRETARRHFAAQKDLVLVAFDEAALGSALRYEPSRRGDLFPHVYGHLESDAALWVRPLQMGPDGEHVFPDLP